MGEDKAGRTEALERALRLMLEHPALTIVAVTDDPATGASTVELEVQLGLPNAWMAEGSSPNGVRAIEPVTLVFPHSYPLRPPRIRLRADFNRSLAHVIPGPPTERPIPCIVEGSLSELLQQQGLAGILNQLVAWLENAALEFENAYLRHSSVFIEFQKEAEKYLGTPSNGEDATMSQSDRTLHTTSNSYKK